MGKAPAAYTTDGGLRISGLVPGLVLGALGGRSLGGLGLGGRSLSSLGGLGGLLGVGGGLLLGVAGSFLGSGELTLLAGLLALLHGGGDDAGQQGGGADGVIVARDRPRPGLKPASS